MGSDWMSVFDSALFTSVDSVLTSEASAVTVIASETPWSPRATFTLAV
jgi:hypothetical protein